MTVGERAVEIHSMGMYNCAQAVVAALADYTGADDALVKSVAAGFGGGARAGELCGAVAGGVMALGLAAAKNGRGKKDDDVGVLTTAYMAKVKEHYGAVRCADIKAGEGEPDRCNEYIAWCAELAAAMIKEYKSK